MADNRPTAEQLSDQLQQALVARLREVSNISDGPEGTVFSGNLPGVRIVTARDIAEVFSGTYDVDYAHTFEAETPARGLVDVVCPDCHEIIPDVSVALKAARSSEDGTSAKVKIKAKTEPQIHVCGQRSIPRPQPPEVEGQVGMDDDEVGSDFDADFVAEAMEEAGDGH